MIKQELAKRVASVCKQLFEVTVKPEITATESEFGDFTSNIAFQLAGRFKQSPHDIATQIADQLESEIIARVEAASSGYVNIWLTDEYWIIHLDSVGDQYGHSKGASKEKVQVEFISANPTGPLTLGNARNAFLGDVLGNVLDSQGCDVTKEYYFNDAGVQIDKLVESVKAAAGLTEVDDKDLNYRGEYIQKLARDYSSELADEGADHGALLTQAIFERYLKPAIEAMGISFDVWFNERELVKSGKTEAALERLDQAGLLYEKDGAKWLAVSRLDDKERDRVLVKSADKGGGYTYLVNDLPYHLDLFENRGFDRAVKVLGADHHGQIPSLVLPLKHLLPDKQIDVLLYQFVRLISDGKEVKMSKRSGTYVTTNELIEEVGNADVARFFFLQRSHESHMDFDLDLAKEQTQKNPYYYVMYAYARAQSIIRQAATEGKTASEGTKALSPEERNIVVAMSAFPDLLAEIADTFEVHKLTYFGLEVARLFHAFYEHVRVVAMEPDEAGQKLYFLQQFTKFLEVYFAVLGIKPQAEM